MLAIDGTEKNMAWSAQLEKFLGIPQGVWRPQMLNSTLYDVLADFPIDSVTVPFATSQRTLAGTLSHRLKPGDLLLTDHGYPGFHLLDDFIGLGINFLIRLPHNGLFSSLQAFLNAGGKDATVKIPPSMAAAREYRRENLPAPQTITARIPKVRLPNGTDVLFATTLLASARYSAADLADLSALHGLPADRARKALTVRCLLPMKQESRQGEEHFKEGFTCSCKGVERAVSGPDERFSLGVSAWDAIKPTQALVAISWVRETPISAALAVRIDRRVRHRGEQHLT